MTDTMTTDEDGPMWSPTRSAAWRTCRLAYWLRYVAKASPSQYDSSAQMNGRLVHTGIAAAYTAARDGEPGMPTMHGYIDQAAVAIGDLVDTGGIITPRMRAEAATEVSKCLRLLPAPAPSAILAIEDPFRITHDGVTVRGALDLALRTGAEAVHVRDWKHSTIPAEIGLNPQMGTYHAAARAMFPWARTITVGLYSVRRHTETVGAFSPETATYVMDRLVSHQREAISIATNVRQGRRSAVDAYPPTTGPSCVSCVFRSYCPTFARAELPVRDEEEVRRTRRRIEALQRCV